MPRREIPPQEPAHDILAAEEFAMPTRDPELEPVHDVLAADEFAVPTVDPDLHHHGPVVLPDDPSGIEEAHDVLAAEAWAMPASRPAPTGAAGLARRHSGRLGRVGLVVVAGWLVAGLRRRG